MSVPVGWHSCLDEAGWMDGCHHPCHWQGSTCGGQNRNVRPFPALKGQEKQTEKGALVLLEIVVFLCTFCGSAELRGHHRAVSALHNDPLSLSNLMAMPGGMRHVVCAHSRL